MVGKVPKLALQPKLLWQKDDLRLWFWIPNMLYIHLFSIFLLFWSYDATDLIKNLQLCLLVVLILLKINFGDAKISDAKTGMPMLETASIIPW